MTQTTSPSPTIADHIDGVSAWTRDTIRPEDWLVPLPPTCLAELDAALAATRGHAGPLHTLGTQGLQLDACRLFAHRLRSKYLDAGPMFAVVDRLPSDRYSDEEMTRAYWLLSCLVSRPVEQTVKGTMLFDVWDTGLASQMVPGSGIRATVTNLDLNFHNDNCFNTVMPDYVGLLCLHPAKRGGTSKAISFHTLHNILRDEDPELLERLYQPLWWDRHKEFPPGDLPYVENPVFEAVDGLPKARFSSYNIRGGYQIRNETPDATLQQALQRLVALFGTPELQCEFDMAAGQIQYVNNRAIGHARSEFEDGATPEQRRHLVRLWLRDLGGIRYPG